MDSDAPTPPADSPSLRLAEIKRLIRLRAMLRRAVATSGDQSDVAQHSYLIQLDGAVEYAMGIACSQIDAKLNKRPGFDDYVNALRQRLGERWPATSYRGVEELHKARNEAQHHGFLTGTNQFAEWTDDAHAFVKAIVEACFDENLELVRTSHLVRDVYYAAKLAKAEHAIDARDRRPRDVLTDIASVFDLAREEAERARHTFSSDPESHTGFARDLAAIKTNQVISELRQVTTAQAFGPMSEYLAYSTIDVARREGLPITWEDATRVFVYVVDWITAWEAFASQHHPVAKRRLEHELGVMPPIVEGAPELSIVESSVDTWMGRITISIRFANVPEPARERIGRLESAIQQELANARLSLDVSVSLDGTVRIAAPPEGLDGFEKPIGNAIGAAWQAIDTQLSREAKRQAEWQERGPEIEAAIHGALRDLPAEVDAFDHIAIDPLGNATITWTGDFGQRQQWGSDATTALRETPHHDLVATGDGLAFDALGADIGALGATLTTLFEAITTTRTIRADVADQHRTRAGQMANAIVGAIATVPTT